MNKQNVAYTYNGMTFNLKKKTVVTHATMWMNLQGTLSKISQTQKDKNCMIPLT